MRHALQPALPPKPLQSKHTADVSAAGTAVLRLLEELCGFPGNWDPHMTESRYADRTAKVKNLQS